jgi:hypothetical protein
MNRVRLSREADIFLDILDCMMDFSPQLAAIRENPMA